MSPSLLGALTSAESDKAVLIWLEVPRQYAERNTLFWYISIMHHVSEAETDAYIDEYRLGR
jgi:disulfide oxidoreductase YuzD